MAKAVVMGLSPKDAGPQWVDLDFGSRTDGESRVDGPSSRVDDPNWHILEMVLENSPGLDQNKSSLPSPDGTSEKLW